MYFQRLVEKVSCEKEENSVDPEDGPCLGKVSEEPDVVFDTQYQLLLIRMNTSDLLFFFS